MEAVYNTMQSFSSACNRGVDFVHTAHEGINCSDATKGRIINAAFLVIDLGFDLGFDFGPAGMVASLFVGDILYRINTYSKAFFTGLLGGEQTANRFRLNFFAKYTVIVLTGMVVIGVTSAAATVFPAVTPLAASAVFGCKLSVGVNMLFDVLNGCNTSMLRYGWIHNIVG